MLSRADGEASPRPFAALRVTWLMLVALALLAPEAIACTVCWGNPADPMVKGANNGIWVLLGVIVFVQIGFVALFWSFWKRAKELKKFKEQFRVIEGGAQR